MKLALLALVSLLASSSGLKVDVGTESFGLAAAGGSVWVAGLGTGDVVRLDPKTGREQSRVSVAPRLFNLVAAPGAVWAVSNGVSSAVRMDAKSGKVTATVPVGSQPYDATWGFGSLWVSNASDGTVSRITGTKVVKTIKAGVEPNGIAAIGRFVWVTDHTGGSLLRVDPATNRITGKVALAGADWVTEANGALWVSQETNVVARVDPASLRVLATVKVRRNPLGSAVVGGQLWVPCIDSNVVVVIDVKSARVVRTIPAGPGPILVLPFGGHAWISHTTGRAVWRV